jgi:hypothetical protein
MPRLYVLLVVAVMVTSSAVRASAGCEDITCSQDCSFSAKGCVAQAKVDAVDNLSDCKLFIGDDCAKLKLRGKVACLGLCGADKSECGAEQKQDLSECLGAYKACVSDAKAQLKGDTGFCKQDQADCAQFCGGQ